MVARQTRLYATFLAAGRELLRGGGGESQWRENRFQVLALLMRLRQVCCHPLLLPAPLREPFGSGLPSAKTDLLQEVVLEAIDSGRRVILFSQFTSFLRLFRPWLEEQGIAYEYLDGATPPAERQSRVDRFNRDPAVPLFLLSLRAGGTGLNLTGADTVIHYDQWWNPMVEDQATDRTHRIGQRKTVTALKLMVRGSVEEKIDQLQQRKRLLFDQVMAGVPARLGELSRADVLFLLGEGGR
jgi:SNF2 family DNA or RNA helicase